MSSNIATVSCDDPGCPEVESLANVGLDSNSISYASSIEGGLINEEPVGEEATHPSYLCINGGSLDPEKEANLTQTVVSPSMSLKESCSLSEVEQPIDAQTLSMASTDEHKVVSSQSNDIKDEYLSNLMLSGFSFVFSSNNHKESRALIEKNGGKVYDKMCKNAQFLLVFEEDEQNPTSKMLSSSIPLVKISYIDALLSDGPKTAIDNYKIVLENAEFSSSSSEGEDEEMDSSVANSDLVHTPGRRSQCVGSDQSTPCNTPTRRSARIRFSSSVNSPFTSPTAIFPNKRTKKNTSVTQPKSLEHSPVTEKENLAQVNVLIETIPAREKEVNSDIASEPLFDNLPAQAAGTFAK